MAVPSFDGYNAAVAGDLVTASDYHKNHPDGYYNTIAATAFAAANRTATSVSSNTIGPGTLIFTLDRFAGWVAGTPVYISESGDPIGNVITGHMTLDQNQGTNEIEVLVETLKGAGTFSAWAVSAIFSVAVVVSPPVAVADGGTGAGDPAGVRAAFELIRQVPVIDASSIPPGTPTPSQTYLVLPVPSPVGPWNGQDNNYARWNGATYDFEVPVTGDMVLVTVGFATGNLWQYNGTAWTRVGFNNPSARIAEFDLTTAQQLTGAEWNTAGGRSPFLTIYVWDAVVDTFLTLPGVPLDIDTSIVVSLRIVNRSGVQFKVNAAGGLLIDGATEIVVADGTAAELGWTSHLAWGWARIY